MSPAVKAIGIAVAAVLVTGCASSASSVAARDKTLFLDGDRLHTGTGATMANTGGSGAASGNTAAPPAAPKEQRANTPVGTDRDGQGPAAGAIVDPTGAATKR